MAKTRKWIAGWLLALGLVVTGLVGCDNSQKVVYEGHWTRARAIVSDTTAMLIFVYYESYENDHYNYIGRGAQLVDVRFNKIYWEARVDDIDQDFTAVQMTDSMVFLMDQNGYCLWAVGQSQPRKFELKWLSEEIEIGDSEMGIRSWKDNQFLVIDCVICSDRKYAILDTSMQTIEKWTPDGDFSWINACNDVLWGSIGGVCLKSINDSCDFALLNNGVDTLSAHEHLHECSLPFFYFYGNYVGLNNSTSYMENPYPKRGAEIGIFGLTEDWKIYESPLYWLSAGGAWFIDSLGNSVGY